MAERNYIVYHRKESEMLCEIGKVVHLWATLEYQLLELSSWGLAMSPRDAAAIFVKFKTFRTALDFTQALCKVRLPDVQYLNSLIDLIAELAGDRNFVAHTPIVANGAGDPAEADWAYSFPTVGPSMSHYYEASTDKREPMGTEEVRQVAADVQFLIEELLGYRQMLLTWPDTWPEKYLRKVEPRRPRLAVRRAASGKTEA